MRDPSSGTRRWQRQVPSTRPPVRGHGYTGYANERPAVVTHLLDVFRIIVGSAVDKTVRCNRLCSRTFPRLNNRKLALLACSTEFGVVRQGSHFEASASPGL